MAARGIEIETGVTGFQSVSTDVEVVGRITQKVWIRQAQDLLYGRSEWYAQSVKEAFIPPEADIFYVRFPRVPLFDEKQHYRVLGSRFQRGLLSLLDWYCPPYILIEMSPDQDGIYLSLAAEELGRFGYICQWQICHFPEFGTPRNRTRAFVVASLKHRDIPNIFPLKRKTPPDKIIGKVRPETKVELDNGETRSLTPDEALMLSGMPRRRVEALRAGGTSDGVMYELAEDSTSLPILKSVIDGINRVL